MTGVSNNYDSCIVPGGRDGDGATARNFVGKD
jgi:hypothetical protein